MHLRRGLHVLCVRTRTREKRSPCRGSANICARVACWCLLSWVEVGGPHCNERGGGAWENRACSYEPDCNGGTTSRGVVCSAQPISLRSTCCAHYNMHVNRFIASFNRYGRAFSCVKFLFSIPIFIRKSTICRAFFQRLYSTTQLYREILSWRSY